MIQRIQSLYLLLAAGLMALCAGVVPLARILSEGSVVEVVAFGLRDAASGRFVARTTHIGILMSLTAALPFVILFLYKNRMLQLRLAAAEVVLLLGAVGIELAYLLKCRRVAGPGNFALTAADVFPAIALILIWLAIRAIVRDHVLVKSVDRIR